MEEQVQRELRELCETILKDQGPQSIIEALTQVQMLYEKLLVINYLQESSAANAPDFSIDEPETIVPQKEPAPQEPEAQEEVINESPVIEKELTDDVPPVPEEASGPKPQPTPKAAPAPPRPDRNASINDRFSSGTLRIGLNDRIAFVKHLFGGAQEDFNRVLSQLNTFTSLEEAEEFIETIVKPDYDWSQKEEYEMRFRHLIQNRFGD